MVNAYGAFEQGGILQSYEYEPVRWEANRWISKLHIAASATATSV